MTERVVYSIVCVALLLAFVLEKMAYLELEAEMEAMKEAAESIPLSPEEVDAIQAARAAQMKLNEIIEVYIKELKTHKREGVMRVK